MGAVILKYVTINFGYYFVLKDITRLNNFLINVAILLVAFLLGIWNFTEFSSRFPLISLVLGLLLLIAMIKYVLLVFKTNFYHSNYAIKIAFITAFYSMPLNNSGYATIILQLKIPFTDNNFGYQSIITNNYDIWHFIMKNIWDTGNEEHNRVFNQLSTLPVEDAFNFVISKKIAIKIRVDEKRPHCFKLVGVV